MLLLRGFTGYIRIEQKQLRAAGGLVSNNASGATTGEKLDQKRRPLESSMNRCREQASFSEALQNKLANPETRPSLLRLLGSELDQNAWKQFTELYSPVIYRYCRRKGLQEADALEVLQDVLLQVYQYIAAFDYDPDRGRFRAWLQSVTHSRLCRYWKKTAKRKECTGHDQQLEQAQASDEFNTEMVAHVTQLALEQIRNDFQADTWAAFEQTWIEQKSVTDVAQKLGRSVGWVYVAKSRVLKRLTKRITQYIDE